jgi:hypothetical protein
MIRAIAAIVLALSFQASIFELVAIPRESALNIPINMTCNFYAVWKKFGCLSDEMRYIQLPIVIALGLLLIVFFSKKEFGAVPSRIIALFVLLIFTLASIVRTIYFIQGHTTIDYLLWTLPLFISAFAIGYWLKKYPWTNLAKLLNEKLKGSEEEKRLELEIEERKRERNKSA